MSKVEIQLPPREAELHTLVLIDPDGKVATTTVARPEDLAISEVAARITGPLVRHLHRQVDENRRRS